MAESPAWRFILGKGWRAVSWAIALGPCLVMANKGLTATFSWLDGANDVVYLYSLDIEAQQRLYRPLWLPFIGCYGISC